MKPVQLLPDANVKAEVAPGSGNIVAAIIVGGIVVCGVGAYFGWARINTMKIESTNISAQAAARTSETQGITQQLLEAGQKQDWSDTAVGFRDEIVSHLQERIDYAKLAAELDNIRPSGTWLTEVSATSGGNVGSTDGVTISGYAPTAEAVSALVTRINATETMDGARVGEITYETATSSNRIYVNFAITAKITLPTDGGSGVGDLEALTVSNGDTSGGGSIALEPEPGYARRQQEAADKAKAAIKPKVVLSSLDQLVKDASSYGGGK